MDEKLKAKQEAKLAKMQKMLDTYTKAFEEDGLIDTKEQAQIDELKALIKEIQQRLEGGGNQDTTSSSDDEFNKLLDEMEAIVKRKQEVLIAWENKLGEDNNQNIA